MASILRQGVGGSRDNGCMPCSPTHLSTRCSARFVSLVLLGWTAACTPALDWREVRPEGANLVLMFPCKPASDARNLDMQGTTVRIHLHACKTENQSFALSYADVADPALVGPALKQMRESLATKLGTNLSSSAAAPLSVNGMTPNPQSLIQPLSGQFPDGSAAFGVVAVFARGTVVYQAVVLGPKRDAAAQGGFVDGIKFIS